MIIFFDADLQEIQSLYNDLVAVSLAITNYDVCRVLVNNEISVDILFDDIF